MPDLEADTGPKTGSASGCPEFDYAKGQPNLYRMMRYKQCLVTELGPEAAKSAFRKKFGWPREPRLVRLPIMGERDFACRHADPFLESATGGIPFVNMPPVVYGEGNHRPVGGVTRSQYVACLDNACVRGRSGAVIADGHILLDFQLRELELVDEEFEWEPAILHASDGVACYLEAPNEAEPLNFDSAFNLLGAHADFFGHWMCEYLPKYASAVFSGSLPATPVLIDAHMPPSHRQSLELLFPERGPLVEIEAFQSVRARRLWTAPNLSYQPLYDSGGGRFTWEATSVSADRIVPIMAELRRRAERQLTIPHDAPKRVFLARRPFRHRKLVNADEIIEMARQRDFAVVYPEELSFAEQITLMMGADRIVSVEGSANFLVQFARPGARLLALSHPFTDVYSDFQEMFAGLGISLTVCAGPVGTRQPAAPHDSDYRIDGARFTACLDAVLAA